MRLLSGEQLDGAIFDVLHTGINLSVPLGLDRCFFIWLIVLNKPKITPKLLKKLSRFVRSEAVDFLFDVFDGGCYSSSLSYSAKFVEGLNQRSESSSSSVSHSPLPSMEISIR